MRSCLVILENDGNGEHEYANDAQPNKMTKRKYLPNMLKGGAAGAALGAGAGYLHHAYQNKVGNPTVWGKKTKMGAGAVGGAIAGAGLAGVHTYLRNNRNV